MNYLITFSLLILIISCSKSNELKKVSPPYDLKSDEVLVESENEITQFPILKLRSHKEVDFSVSNPLNETIKKKKLKLSQSSFIRSRMKRIIESNSIEELSIDDLFRFESYLTEEAKTKLFSELRFENIEDQNIWWNTQFQIASSYKGNVKNISYSVSLYNNSNNNFLEKDYYDLYRYENQNEVIELSNSTAKTYRFNSLEKNFSMIGNKLISNHFVIYEVEDFLFKGKSLKDWKREILTEMSVLVVSTKNIEKTIYINKGESLSEALRRQDPSVEISINGNVKNLFGTSGSWKLIGQFKVHDSVQPGNVIGLFLNDLNEFIPKSKRILQEGNKNLISLTQNKNDSINIFIQGSATKYELSKWHESHAVHRTEEVQCDNRSGECLLYRELPVLRSCQVDRRKVIENEVEYDSSLVLDDYSLKMGHRSYSLDELKELGVGNYYIEKGILNIKIYSFKSIAHERIIEISIKDSLKEIDVIQDFGLCSLRRISRGGNTIHSHFVREHLNTFSPSSYRSKVGLARRMNAIISY